MSKRTKYKEMKTSMVKLSEMKINII